MKANAWLWSTVAVLLVATALRAPALGDVPPGLYHDEVFHGLDAVDVIAGQAQLYFPTNNGREPLYIYLVAASVGILGRSPFALRLPSFFVGVLTVAAAAAMGRALFSRRVGLLGAAILSVTLWHVHLSRTGFRAVLLPLFIALAVWQVVEAIKAGRWVHWIAAGVLCGLSAYTYTAARMTPVAVGAFVVYTWMTRSAVRNPRSARGRRLWAGIGVAILAGLVVVLPLVSYALRYPETVLGRPGQVSVFSPEINGGDAWGTLGQHVLRALGMFFVRGDRIWRHNVPWRPVFDPVLGAAFILGLAVLIRRARRSTAAAFILIWTTVMLLPTVLAEDAPHFLRGVGVLPVVVLVPALGLDWLTGAVRRVPARPPARRWAKAARVVAPLVLAVPLLVGLVSTVWAYFGRYAHEPLAGYWFEEGAGILAGRVNRFLGRGWDGDRMLHGDPGDRRVLLDPRLWSEWPQVRFLVAAPEAVSVNTGGRPSQEAVAAFAWPYAQWEWARSVLPNPREVTVEAGPLSQGDRDPEPFTTFLAFYGTVPDPSVPVIARFSGGVEYLGATATPIGDALHVRLRWRATAPLPDDYTVFLHCLTGGEVVAQADSQPAGGYYPTSIWQPGDIVNDDHLLEDCVHPDLASYVLRFGFWQPETGAVLYLLDEAGNPAGDWIDVPAGG